MSFIQNFIIGKHKPARQQIRTALLQGQLSVLTFIVGFIYMFFDGIHSNYKSYWIYFLLIFFSIGIFFLNRTGRYFIASILLLLFLNFVVFLFNASDVNASGVDFFYIPVSLGSLALFGYERRMIGALFCVFSFSLFLLTFYTDIHIVTPNYLPQDYLRTNYLINYTMIFLVSFLVINFLINTNYKVEILLGKNEAELVKSRRRYELAIHASKAGIWEWNILSGEVYNSPTWKQMLGYKNNEIGLITLEKFLAIVYPDDRDRVAEAIQLHLDQHVPYSIEFRMFKKDGSVIWVLDSGQAIWNNEGKAVEMVGSVIDITKRKTDEEKIIQQNELLAKTNDELDRFVYSASHDLRAPLSSILGLINLANKSTSQEEHQMILNLIKSRVDKLDEFIKDIISYSRNSRLEVDSKPVNLKSNITRIFKDLDHMPGSDKINVVINCPDDLVINTDATRLSVILNNLFSNAIRYSDFTKPESIIKVEVTRVNQSIEIQVIDNGLGIDEQFHEKIFQMFFRASDKSDGTGLGLYIVMETIQKLQGKIKVNSSVGVGSTFTVLIPES